MTTVAYKNNTLAADSRCSTNYSHRHLTKCDKLFRLKSGGILGIAGDDDVRDLVSLLDTVTSSDHLPTKESLADLKQNSLALLLLPTGELFHIEIEMVPYSNSDEWTGSITQIKESIAAIGSGEELALGAMEFGATAEEAVRVACRWDLYSALPVTTMSIDTPEKKTKRKPKSVENEPNPT